MNRGTRSAARASSLIQMKCRPMHSVIPELPGGGTDQPGGAAGYESNHCGSQGPNFCGDSERFGTVYYLQPHSIACAVRSGRAVGLPDLLVDGERPADGICHHAGTGGLQRQGVLVLFPGAGGLGPAGVHFGWPGFDSAGGWLGRLAGRRRLLDVLSGGVCFSGGLHWAGKTNGAFASPGLELIYKSGCFLHGMIW